MRGQKALSLKPMLNRNLHDQTLAKISHSLKLRSQIEITLIEKKWINTNVTNRTL